MKILLVLFLSCSNIFAFDAQTMSISPDIQEDRPASDLIYQGEHLLLNKAHDLQQNGLDLSTLDVAESDIYSKEKTEDEEWNFQKESAVAFLGNVKSSTGNFRFSALQESDQGKETYHLFISKKVHNILLRRNLLLKLGYRVPQIERLNKLRVDFDTAFDREVFEKELAENTLGEPARWVIESGEKYLILQDILVMKDRADYYNVAIGAMPDSVIKGRRVLNSLLLPYTLVSFSESANLFNWNAAVESNGQVRLDIEEAEGFSTTWSDARWMLKKIKNLTRADYKAIVDGARLPNEVALLLTEKIISRRNSLLKKFKIGAPDIAVVEDISSGNLLTKGKLSCENWQDEISKDEAGKETKTGKKICDVWHGYGSRFIYGDPESPLSLSEIFALGKMKLYSNIISNLVTQFNKNIAPQTDVAKEIEKRQLQKAEDRFYDYLKTGKIKKVPFNVFVIPRFGTQLIASRDVVAGSYLGTDNQIQLADNFGMSVDAGVYLGTEGITGPYALSGDVRASFSRIYSHLRPIKSIKKALKEPYKNILVMLVTNSLGNLLNGLDKITATNLVTEQDLIILKKNSAEEKVIAIKDKITRPSPCTGPYCDGASDAQQENEIEAAKKEERKKIIEENESFYAIIESFKKNMDVGESLIITDSIGAGLNVSGSYGISEVLTAMATFNASQSVLSRLHIYRSGEDEMQVYRDIGNMTSIGLTLTMKAKIPVIKINVKYNGGTAKTKFFKISINKTVNDKKKLLENMKAIRSVFKTNSTEYLKTVVAPYELTHDYSEVVSDTNFLLWKWSTANSKNSTNVSHPESGQRQFFRRYTGERTGTNFETIVVDVINALITEYSDPNSEAKDLAVSSTSNGNPGDSIYGSSSTRTVSFEGEVGNNDQLNHFHHQFAQVYYEWRGWEISKSGMEKLFAALDAKYKRNFFAPSALNDTKEIQLFALRLSIYVYERAFEHMASLSNNEIRDIFNKHYVVGLKRRRYDEEERIKQRIIKDFIGFKDEYLTSSKKQDPSSMSKYGLKMISQAEEKLNIEGLLKIVGGEKNIYIAAKLNGFRKGDEGADQSDRGLVANSIGSVGDDYYAGPMNSLRNNLGMTEAEFFIYWLMRKL
jgi:hypothetical protein